ncbi:MAG: SagB/ThcOx family dehydrogenase [Phormidium sp. GEM2.Bin31]|nr:MAG: SagB/ThcOx family dehydrogenase [Phormidium sp. GEM2.Bin31]
MTRQKFSIAKLYHERTKYDPETINQRVPNIDWDRPPVPFKDYPIGTRIDLKPHIGDRQTVLSRLSHLLYCTYGVTARIPQIAQQDLLLRASPSAGGLYPAEVYVLSRGGDDLPAGRYNYQVRDHSLVRFWDGDPGEALEAACFGNPALQDAPFVVVTTAVFFRSSWRYQARAYRRIHLDTGHLLGNLDLAAALTDYRPYLIAGFDDGAVNELLYLNAEEEGAIAVVALQERQNAALELPLTTALASDADLDYPELPDGSLLGYLHQASAIEGAPESSSASSAESESQLSSQGIEDKYNFPFCTKVSTASSPLDWGVGGKALEATLLQRRSTRAYDGGAEIELEQVKALLNFAYQPQPLGQLSGNPSADSAAQEWEQPDLCDRSLIQTFIATTAVAGLDDGCYYYAPQAQELRQIRFKNFRRELHFLCLGQDLGRDAAMVLFHTADLQGAIARWGDRAYRYLHLDAGHLGQRLNLAATYLRLGVSGIAGFFDDHVNDVLGIPPDEAVLYITTIGQPRTSRRP